jgi:hypothetical protein
MPRCESETESAKVLENNVTKALLNTVDLGPNLGRLFINWLNTEHLGRKGLKLEPADVKGVRILKGPTKEEIKDKKIIRILLGIKKHEDDYESDTEKGRLVDGTIVGTGWLVAIESKLEGMNKRQFIREEKGIQPAASIQVLWKDVKDCFEKASKCDNGSQLTDVDRLFIEQFSEFLKSKKLIPSWGGIREEHYDFFLRPHASTVTKKELGNLFRELRDELTRYKYEDGERLDNLYWEPPRRVKGLGKKEDKYAEFSLYCRTESSTPVIITLWADGKKEQRGCLEVYAHIEGKRNLKRLATFIEKRGGRGKLAKKLRSDRFRGCYIGLYDKDWNKINSNYEYSCAEITNDNLMELAEKAREMAAEKVNFVLSKCFVLHEPTDTCETQLPPDGEAQLREIAEAIRVLHPFALFASGTSWEKITEW